MPNRGVDQFLHFLVVDHAHVSSDARRDDDGDGKGKGKRGKGKRGGRDDDYDGQEDKAPSMYRASPVDLQVTHKEFPGKYHDHRSSMFFPKQRVR